ncbi:MAG: hypothetical protein ACI9OJ_004465, partial [Myxococcota bacterium]
MSLLSIEPMSVGVDQTLVVELRVQNPGGLAVQYEYRGPDLAGLKTTASITGTPAGGEFRWTPLASHVGAHQFDFIATSEAGSSKQSVVLTVVPQATAAPVFLSPGSGGTFDLDATDCVEVTFDTKDDDSESVEIRAVSGLPEGALLQPAGAKGAELLWCPTDVQINASLTWPMVFEADDGEHAPTSHRYIAVLRTDAQANCPGQPPIVSVLSPAAGASVDEVGGVSIAISVIDDFGIRDAPVLYYSADATALAAPGSFQQTEFELSGDDQWTAVVPPVGVAVGEQVDVRYFITAIDNDDPLGTACDHRVDTQVSTFVATNSGSKVDACGLCTAAEDCASGLCEAS